MTTTSTDYRKDVNEMIDKRKELESQLDDLLDVLKSHGCDMNTPLVTSDGFPRSDIDVPQVRTTRAEIIRLQNDLKNLMGDIEKGLVHYFQSASSSSSSTNASTTATSTTTKVAFAKVGSVAPESPALKAGLQDGDRIITFGSANAANHDGLKKVALIVKESDQKAITVEIQRGQDYKTLELTPDSNYSGRGSLGFHLLPL